MRIRIAGALLFVLCLVANASAQSPEQSGMLKTDKGVLVVWNAPGNYYTIEIKGQKIVPAQQPLLFQVDGLFFQIQTVATKAFLKSGDDKNLDDKTILGLHRDWEGDYISGIVKKNLKIDSEWLKLANGKDALAWSYDMPKAMIRDGKSAKKQFYLAAVKGDMVFLLNSALTGSDADKDVKQLLIATMNTLKPSDKPLSLQKAADMLRNN